MTDLPDCEYHAQRARAELDMAYRSERPEVISAHLRLSSLHMERAGAAFAAPAAPAASPQLQTVSIS